MNLVEMIAEDSAFDQPCAHGNRVDGHAVYCHNDAWAEAQLVLRRAKAVAAESEGR